MGQGVGRNKLGGDRGWVGVGVGVGCGGCGSGVLNPGGRASRPPSSPTTATSPQITRKSRNTFINIYSIITKNSKISYPWLRMAIIKVFITEKYKLNYDTCLIERSRRISNPAGRSSRILNSAGRLLCVTWLDLLSRIPTPGRSYPRKIRNHFCEGPVE